MCSSHDLHPLFIDVLKTLSFLYARKRECDLGWTIRPGRGGGIFLAKIIFKFRSFVEFFYGVKAVQECFLSLKAGTIFIYLLPLHISTDPPLHLYIG
jgi:hypothetical protein